MKTFGFLFVFIFIYSAYVGAEQTVEIISHGKTYASLEDYKSGHLANTLEVKPVPELKLEPDVQPDPYSKAKQALVKASYQEGVGVVVLDFKQNWDHPWPSLPVSALDLEHRLEAVADGRAEPILLMADPKKVRLMSYVPKKETD